MSENRQPAVNSRPRSERPWLFQPGQSANPGGRTRTADVAALARQHTAAAIEALADALRDPKTRVAAAVALLNRGHGMPPQKIDAEGAQNLTLMHLVASREISERIEQAMANGSPLPPIIDGDAAAVEQKQPNGNGSGQPVDLSKPALE